jgi:glutamate racemase
VNLFLPPLTSIRADFPIGVFDSGIGGLSVLRHIHTHLPNEALLYFADSGFAPYGGKPEEVIVSRTLTIATFLIQQGAKGLVVACNTATAAAINVLRQHYPSLPVVGVEPGLKPATTLTKTGTVGVLATERTLASSKFRLLQEQLTAATGTRFLLQACSGLADQIEKGELDSVATTEMLERYIKPLLAQNADTLVLGCTHYPFVEPLIRQITTDACVRDLIIIDTGEPVARQLARRLQREDLQSSRICNGEITAYTTGTKEALTSAFSKLLSLKIPVMHMSLADGLYIPAQQS